ncbi:hypothetical protein [Streptomyces sp900116325]|uniref:hypothetical protein n=1 Tax=Streptomyces sp. 900116325 TaxID=3154295 RepID=UPI0033AF4D2E
MKLSCTVQHVDTEASVSDAAPLASFPRKHGPVNSGESMTANARRTSQRVIHFAAPSFSAEIPSFAARFVHPAHDPVNGWQ